MTRPPSPRGSFPADRLWATRLLALVALLNLGLVAVDRSFIPWRDGYLRYLPSFTAWYGKHFKGIEAHRDTIQYLQAVDQLQSLLQTDGEGRSPQIATQLATLRMLSTKLVDENPFALANKSGVLERIKNEMRDRMNNESSKQAFNAFWTTEHLQQAGWQQELAFFDRTIRPRMVTNYYRNIDEGGGFVDRFWQIDLGFIALFGTVFLTRTIYLHRRQQRSWLDVILDYWYDLFLLLPLWPGLRILPVAIRLHQAKWLNLQPIQTHINHSITASLAAELTEIVISRLIEQTQDILRRGVVSQWLLKPDHRPRYIDLTGVDEVEAIANRILSLLVHHILPKVQPDIEAIIQHTLDRILQQLPLYAGLQSIPGLSDLPHRLTTQVATEVSQTTYRTLVAALEDTTATNLTRRLIDHLGEALRTEVQKETTVQEIEALLVSLLDEIKVNYVSRINAEPLPSWPKPPPPPYPVPRLRQS